MSRDPFTESAKRLTAFFLIGQINPTYTQFSSLYNAIKALYLDVLAKHELPHITDTALERSCKNVLVDQTIFTVGLRNLISQLDESEKGKLTQLFDELTILSAIDLKLKPNLSSIASILKQ